MPTVFSWSASQSINPPGSKANSSAFFTCFYCRINRFLVERTRFHQRFIINFNCKSQFCPQVLHHRLRRTSLTASSKPSYILFTEITESTLTLARPILSLRFGCFLYSVVSSIRKAPITMVAKVIRLPTNCASSSVPLLINILIFAN